MIKLRYEGLLVFLIIGGLLVSCDSGRNHYLADSFRTKISEDCIDLLWGLDVEKRGRKFVFRDSTVRIVTTGVGKELIIDTVVSRTHTNRFGGLEDVSLNRLREVSQCLSNVAVSSCRGFTENPHLLEVHIGDKLVLYYLPEGFKLTSDQQEKVDEKAHFIDSEWFYIVKQREFESTIW